MSSKRRNIWNEKPHIYYVSGYWRCAERNYYAVGTSCVAAYFNLKHYMHGGKLVPKELINQLALERNVEAARMLTTLDAKVAESMLDNPGEPNEALNALLSAGIGKNPGDRGWTPCVGVCSTTTGDKTCRGCGRTVAEIRDWAIYPDWLKETIKRLLPGRFDELRKQGLF